MLPPLFLFVDETTHPVDYSHLLLASVFIYAVLLATVKYVQSVKDDCFIMLQLFVMLVRIIDSLSNFFYIIVLRHSNKPKSIL